MQARSKSRSPGDEDILTRLEQRLGRLYARQRLGIETDHDAEIFGGLKNFFHVESWYSIHAIIRTALKVSGLYGRGRRNAERVELRHNEVRSEVLPAAFDGFTILHLSDLHVEQSEGAMRRAGELARGLHYDLCVLTGDYRDATHGDFAATLDGVRRLREQLQGPIYGVLGNHDSVRQLPELEALGIRMLVNECAPIARGAARIHLAGIDDAHYFRVHNIEKTRAPIPEGEFSILLSHTPEVYRQAAHAGFHLMLSGHTHGGQICLPGAIPITLDAALPRRFGAGAWQHRGMHGYTSAGTGTGIVPVRFNCPPEITLHRLRRG